MEGGKHVRSAGDRHNAVNILRQRGNQVTVWNRDAEEARYEFALFLAVVRFSTNPTSHSRGQRGFRAINQPRLDVLVYEHHMTVPETQFRRGGVVDAITETSEFAGRSLVEFRQSGRLKPKQQCFCRQRGQK